VRISRRICERPFLIATAAKRTPANDPDSACMSPSTAAQDPESTNSASTTGAPS